jgi:hypothetical protein
VASYPRLLSDSNRSRTSTALMLLDDTTPQDVSAPTCVDSALASPPIHSMNDAMQLSLRI